MVVIGWAWAWPLLVVATALRAAVTLVGGLGMVVGRGSFPVGAMTATSLAGRRALDELNVRRGEYEAALALGLQERDAALLVTRRRRRRR